MVLTIFLVSVGCVNELEGNTDPICHLLAWQYTLKHTHNQPETAEALNIFIERIKESEILTDTTVQSIMLFLLYLRGKQPEEKQGNLVCFIDRLYTILILM